MQDDHNQLKVTIIILLGLALLFGALILLIEWHS
jgi:hypothetical protein